MDSPRHEELGLSCDAGWHTPCAGCWVRRRYARRTFWYPNAPFQFVLRQTGTTLRGEYSDGHDRSVSVNGAYTSPTLIVDVDFGDGHLHFSGTVINARTATGNMWTSALGNRLYPFTLTR